MSYRLVFFILTLCSFLGCASFVTWYHFSTKGKWRADEAGVMLMYVYGVLAIFLLWSLFTPMVVRWHSYVNITLVLFSLFAVGTWWPLRMLVLSQRRVRQKEMADDEL